MSLDHSLAWNGGAAEQKLNSPRISFVGRLRALWALYLLSLRQQLHGKRWVAMTGLFLLPSAIVLLVRYTAPHPVPAIALEFLACYLMMPQALLPLVGLIYAAGIIQDEQEEQTITYLLIRPISRWAMYLVKLSAAITGAIALTAIFTAFTYWVIFAGQSLGYDSPVSRCLKTMAIHSLAVAAYCALFGLLGLLIKRILLVGIVYIVLVEGVLSFIPLGIRVITIVYYARIIAARSLAFWAQAPNADLLSMPRNLAVEHWGLDNFTNPPLPGHPELQTCILVLMLGIAITGVFGALICSRREFHVKTPDKAS